MAAREAKKPPGRKKQQWGSGDSVFSGSQFISLPISSGSTRASSGRPRRERMPAARISLDPFLYSAARTRLARPEAPASRRYFDEPGTESTQRSAGSMLTRGTARRGTLISPSLAQGRLKASPVGIRPAETYRGSSTYLSTL